MKKISEFLLELNSHSIYNHEKVAKDFKEQTGYDAIWPSYLPEKVVQDIKDRGVGGQVKAGVFEELAYGYEIAESLATAHADYSQGWIEGRGTRFRAAIEKLEEHGK